jgi:hypothetical protein
MRNCCDMAREGSGGVIYSYTMLGVLCPSCEWEAQRDFEEHCERERRAAMTQDQRDSEDISGRWAAAIRRMNRIAEERRWFRLWGNCPF